MLVKTLNSIYQLSRKDNQYYLTKLEALKGAKYNTMATGRCWIGDEASFEKDGCLHFRQGGVTILRTSIVTFEAEPVPFDKEDP